jgi:hypothetical protein
MATVTKTQLIDQLSALRLHCDRIETELASLKASRPANTDRRPAYVPVRNEAAARAHAEYTAALLAAKAEAMRTGKSVALVR